jgi:hypothetical protein
MGSSKFINQEIQMYYLVNVDHNSMKVHLTRNDLLRVLRSAIYPMQWMGLMICCGMVVKRMEMLRVSVRKMKALTVKMETVILIGEGRENVTHFVY